jgi:hypothetical protein
MVNLKKLIFFLLLLLTKYKAIFAADTHTLLDNIFTNSISTFDDELVITLLKSCEQTILGSERSSSEVSVCKIKSGSENLGIFYIIEKSSKEPILVLKFLGIDLGWLNADETMDKIYIKSLYGHSHDKANKEITNNNKAAVNLLTIKTIPSKIKIILPHKYLRFNYTHRSLNELTQTVSIMVAARGILVRESLEKILEDQEDARREKHLKNLATIVAQGIADFHILTLELSKAPFTNEVLKNIPADLLELRAQLHGDLHAGNLLWDQEQSCLNFIDCESFGCFPKMPVFLDLIYFLEAAERIFDHTKHLANLSSFTETFISTYLDHLSESFQWKTNVLDKKQYQECYFSHQQEIKKTIEILRD